MRHSIAAVMVAQVLLAVAVPHPLGAAELYVSPSGNDGNPGTKREPFRTVAAARDALRASSQKGGHQILLRDGDYVLAETLAFDERDSGLPDAPNIVASCPGERARLVGGIPVPAHAVRKTTDQTILSRILCPEARERIYEIDLEAQGIEHAAPYPDKFTDNGGIFELFFNQKRMPIARYPDEFGAMTIQRVLANGGGQEKPGSWGDYYGGTAEQRRALETGNGPRPGVFEYRPEHAAAHARWARVLDRGVWLKGYWRVVWQNETVRVGAIDTEKQTVTLAVPVSHGIGSKYHRPHGSGAEVYWVMNLLEALDRPGEWAVDFKDKKLFFYPPGPLAAADILISDTDTPIIELKGTHNIELRGLVAEGTLGDGIRIVRGTQNALRDCTVRNVAKYGVMVEGGSSNVVESCDLYALGAGGVGLSGGNARATPRVAAGHRVENCDIHHFGEIERVYAPGVNVGYRGGGGGSRTLDAVGMVVRHNAIHHCPHAGVLFNSFDNVFEYNEVFQFALVSNDMGAFYSYAKPGGIGNNTFRYNFMHSSPEGDGVYYDNVADHSRVYGNIAYRLGPMDAERKAQRGCGFLIKNSTRNRVDIFNNMAVDCKVGYSINAGAGSVIRDNVSVACGGDPGTPGLKTYPEDPGFADLAGLDLDLRDDAAVYSDLGSFEPIPFEKIGLYTDVYRPRSPPYRRDHADWQPGEDRSDYDILDR